MVAGQLGAMVYVASNMYPKEWLMFSSKYGTHPNFDWSEIGTIRLLFSGSDLGVTVRTLMRVRQKTANISVFSSLLINQVSLCVWIWYIVAKI